MAKYTHLIKLSVGSETVEDLAIWQKLPQAQSPDGFPWHITRMWPKREEEILGQGSIYWVIKGVIQCRNKIVRLDEVMGGDGIRRCAIVCDRELVRVEPTLKRAFQGWRYLKPEDAPSDLGVVRDGEEALPASLSAALAEIGVR